MTFILGLMSIGVLWWRIIKIEKWVSLFFLLLLHQYSHKTELVISSFGTGSSCELIVWGILNSKKYRTLSINWSSKSSSSSSSSSSIVVVVVVYIYIVIVVIVIAARQAVRPTSSNQLLGQTFRPISSNQLLANYFSIHAQHSKKEGRQGRIE